MKKNLDIYLFIALSLLGILTRTVFHLGPNVEFVTVSALAAGYFFSNKKIAFAVPLSIMIITDMIIGNTSIFIYTWSGFIFSSLLGVILSSNKIQNGFSLKSGLVKSFGIGLGGSVVSVLFFYLWTNFGVVVTSSMYPDTLQGLVNSYINALPFLKNQLAGNIMLSPIIFTLIYLIKDYYFQVVPGGKYIKHA